MTRRNVIMLWLVLGLAGVPMLLLIALSTSRARARAMEAVESLQTTAGQAYEVLTLRHTAMPVAPAEGIDAALGITPRLSAALSSAGLPPSILANVSPQADRATPIDGGGEGGLQLVRRHATVTFT